MLLLRLGFSVSVFISVLLLNLLITGQQAWSGAADATQGEACPRLEGLYQCPDEEGFLEIHQSLTPEGFTEYQLTEDGHKRTVRADGQTYLEEEFAGSAYYRRTARSYCDSGKLRLDSKIELSWNTDFSTPFYVGLFFNSLGVLDAELISVTDVVEWLIDPETGEPVHDKQQWLHSCKAFSPE